MRKSSQCANIPSTHTCSATERPASLALLALSTSAALWSGAGRAALGAQDKAAGAQMTGAAAAARKDGATGASPADVECEAAEPQPAHDDDGAHGHAGGGHGPVMAAYLLLNGIMAPVLLSQPYIFAVMTWGGAITFNVIMSLASLLCMYHQCELFHFDGGRHTTYKRMGTAVLSGTRLGHKWGGPVIATLQFTINIGTGITNMILAGQILQSVYTQLCTDTARCTLTGTSAWIGISGAVSYLTFIALPDMASLAWACISGTLLIVFYCASGIAVSILEGDPATAVHTLTDGPPLQQVMNALNGIGMLLFLYGLTVMPEIQAVLRPDKKTGNTARPMMVAATMAHCVYVPLYLLVGIIGYNSYGASVDALLLFSQKQPRGLVVSAELAAVVQVQLVSQVMMLPVFEAVERVLLRRFPHARWLAAPGQQLHQQQLARAPSWQLSDSEEPNFTHASSLASHLNEMQRSLSDVVHHGSGALVRAASGHWTGSARRRAPVLPLQEGGGPDAAAAADDAFAAAARAPASPPAAAPRHGASLALMFVSRTLITGLLLFVAAALPFFSSIMGLIGAIGFGPITYALPTLLFMVAYPHRCASRWVWWGNAAFIAFWLLASLVAAVGAAFTIVSTASTYHFFS